MDLAFAAPATSKLCNRTAAARIECGVGNPARSFPHGDKEEAELVPGISGFFCSLQRDLDGLEPGANPGPAPADPWNLSLQKQAEAANGELSLRLPALIAPLRPLDQP